MTLVVRRAAAAVAGAVCLTLGSLTAAYAAPSVAHDHAHDHQQHHKHATVLTLDLAKQSLLGTHQVLRAYLTDANGEPVRGARIHMFTPGHQNLCSQSTDANGEAVCDAPLAAPTEVANEVVNGFDARFDGSDELLPSQAHAPSTLVVGDI